MTEETVYQEDSNLDENLDSNQEVEESNEELTKAQEIAKNQRIRAEKAEAELKALKKPQPKEEEVEKETPKNEKYPYKEIIAFRGLSEEEAGFLEEESDRLNKVPSELRKDPYFKFSLEKMREEKETAEATNTKTTKSGKRRDSSAEILSNFEKGIVDDTPEGAKKLAQVLHEKKLADKAKRD